MREDLEYIRKSWQKEPEKYVKKALTKDINIYSPEVQTIIIEVAKERGIINENEAVFLPPKTDQQSWIAQSPVISSSLTFFYKYIFSTLWIAGFGVGTIADFFVYNENDRFSFLGAWILGTIFIYWGCIRLKRVEIRDGNILISNFFKRISVPLTEIVAVSESRFINIHPVWITFRHKTKYGRQIVFMPKFDFSSIFFLSHPVVKEIRTLIEAG